MKYIDRVKERESTDFFKYLMNSFFFFFLMKIVSVLIRAVFSPFIINIYNNGKKRSTKKGQREGRKMFFRST